MITAFALAETPDSTLHPVCYSSADKPPIHAVVLRGG